MFFLAPVVAALTARTLGTIVATTVVSTVASAASYDAYQKLKESAQPNDNDKRNRNT